MCMPCKQRRRLVMNQQEAEALNAQILAAANPEPEPASKEHSGS